MQNTEPQEFHDSDNSDNIDNKKSVAHNYYELKFILDNLNHGMQDIKTDLRSIKDEFKEVNHSMLDMDYRIKKLDEELIIIKDERRFFYIFGAFIVACAVFMGPQLVNDLLLMLIRRF